MFRTTRPLAALLAGFAFVNLSAFSSRSAHAVDRGSYSMDILIDGNPVREYDARGTTYVEARKGHEYAVRLTNHTSERIAIALSVDGLNSIDAKTTTAADARKWILDPYQTITLDGWQTSSSTARRFFFTSEDKSYGAWLGKKQNLGIIAAAVYRERRIVPPPCRFGRTCDDRDSSPREQDGSRSRAVPPSEMNEAAGAPAEPQRHKDAEAKAEKRAPLDELAATGIGRELDHQVVRVSFDQEDSPAAVLEVRYEYRDALARLGVVPYPRPRREDPLARREGARGFEDTRFAPDPYGRSEN